MVIARWEKQQTSSVYLIVFLTVSMCECAKFQGECCKKKTRFKTIPTVREFIFIGGCIVCRGVAFETGVSAEKSAAR